MPISGFEGYEVSSYGNVRSYRPRNGRGGFTASPRLLRPRIDKYGYPMLTLRRDDKDVSKTIHRLVLEAFSGLCPEGMQACHNNGNPEDNRIENLRWDTISENAWDRSRHGRAAGNFPVRRGVNHGRAKFSEEQVLEIRELFSEGVRKAELARKFNTSIPQITNIVTRKTWTHV